MDSNLSMKGCSRTKTQFYEIKQDWLVLKFGMPLLQRIDRQVSSRASFLLLDQGDVTWDESQRKFWAQQIFAMLEQCCNYSEQCRNNVATLFCAKNRRWESSRVTSPKRKFCLQRFAVVVVVVYCIFSELTLQDGRGKNTANLVWHHDNNFVWKTFPPNFTLHQTGLFVQDQNTLT